MSKTKKPAPEELNKLRRKYGDDYLIQAARIIRQSHGRGPKVQDDSPFLEHAACLLRLGKVKTPFEGIRETVGLMQIDYSKEATLERLRKKIRGKVDLFNQAAEFTSKLLLDIEHLNNLLGEEPYFRRLDAKEVNEIRDIGMRMDALYDFWDSYVQESPLVPQRQVSLDEACDSVSGIARVAFEIDQMTRWVGEGSDEAAAEIWEFELRPMYRQCHRTLLSSTQELVDDIPLRLIPTFKLL